MADQYIQVFISKTSYTPENGCQEAAKRLGVGRPALSNLLNGKAALSTEMAARLEKYSARTRRNFSNSRPRSTSISNARRLRSYPSAPMCHRF